MSDALKLTAYFGERERAGGRLLADALLDAHACHGARASVLLRGAEGFARLHELRTDRLLSFSEDLPAVSIAIDEPERIDALLGATVALGGRGLITLERARMITGPAAATALANEVEADSKLTVFVGRRERSGGRAAFVAVCELLRRHGLAGATVLLGVDGTRSGRRARATFLGRNADVPMMVIAVGESEPIARALPELAALLRDPLVALERVRVCKRDGQLLTAPHALPADDAAGLPLWQQLTVYGSQAAEVDGRALHLELIRRLRAPGAAGVTAIRGIWGFHGDHAPHGDRLLQLRRHVPMMTVVLERPERAARSFEVIDALTARGGLVTSEIVPAVRVVGAGDAGAMQLARHRS